MSEILVCGKWPLKLLEGKAGGYFQWRDTKASRRNSECLLELVTGLPEGMSVAEHFGGVGEASFLKLKALITVTPFRNERAAAQ